jgi:hypothetical protein
LVDGSVGDAGGVQHAEQWPHLTYCGKFAGSLGAAPQPGRSERPGEWDVQAPRSPDPV